MITRLLKTWSIVKPWFIGFLLSTAAMFLGYTFGQTIQGIMTVNWSLNWTGYWSAVTIYGLFLGVPQWWIIRRHMQRASLWILISVMGWILTGMAWINFHGASGEDSIIYGIVTGIGLA